MITLCMCGFIVNASKCDNSAIEEHKEKEVFNSEYEDLDVNFFN